MAIGIGGVEREDLLALRFGFLETLLRPELARQRQVLLDERRRLERLLCLLEKTLHLLGAGIDRDEAPGPLDRLGIASLTEQRAHPGRTLVETRGDLLRRQVLRDRGRAVGRA